MPELRLSCIERPGQLPLSTDQYRIWFLHQLNKSLNHFNINFAFEINGPLDVNGLRLALTDIVQRHEIMRTSFKAKDGVPFLNIAENLNLLIPLHQVDPAVAEDVNGYIREQMNKAGKVPFMLDEGPMFRMEIYQLADTQFRMLFTIHHIIADFDSLKLLMKELFHFYRVRVEGAENTLPALTVQFSDYACWQNERLRTGELDKQLEYWKAQLTGDIPVLRMPMDRPRGQDVTNNGATKRITFSQQLTDKLTELSKQHSVTLFITLVSAYQVLLHKYTNQEDINIGTPITTRNQPELKDLIGLFINTLVLKSDLSGDPDFLTLLQRNRKIAFGAFARQEIPYEKLVAELNPDRNLNHNLFFQTMVMFLEPEQNSNEIVPNVIISPFTIDKKTTTFELTLSFSYIGSALTLLVDYNTDLYNEETIAYLLERFKILLEKLVAQPEKVVKSLSLLSPEEEKAMLATYVGPQLEKLGKKTFNEVWAERVARSPQSVALISGTQSRTYSELDCQIHDLAQKLMEEGVKAGTLVPVLAARNIEMIVAFLAILRCGAAYVPINPTHPAERLNGIVEQCRTSAVLSTLPETSVCPLGSEVRVLNVLTLLKVQGIVASEAPAFPQMHPLDLAYVIFTSGSTGQPKGVMISHDSLVNHCENMAERFELVPEDKVLQFTSPSFDVSVQEIFPTLMQGATLVLWDYDGIEETRAFIAWLAQRAISILNLTTAHWNNIIADCRHDGLSLPESLRLVIVGGEKVSATTLRDWSHLTQGKIRWINDYGLTETTCTASMYSHSESDFEGKTVPIGSPLNNVTIYILDDQMNPAPKGVYGNIFIAGRGVALGYYNNPELTKAHFIPNPFQPGRLFKTGDIGRIRFDGTLEFDSRDDQQVKIRGNRVELGEVEKHLLACKDVRKVFLRVYKPENAQDNAIAAYVVLNNGQDISLLRSQLKQTLPDYMIPAFFIPMDDFPLTTNGKVDQKQLPLPEVQAHHRQTFIEPWAGYETQLAAIWCELLNTGRVSADASFFDIGGNSLIATTLVSRIKSAMDIQISLRLLFEMPKLCDLAVALDQLKHGILPADSDECLIKLQPKGEGIPLFYIHPVGGTVSCYFSLSRRLGSEQPFYALQAYAMTHKEYAMKTVEEMAQLYLQEIQRVRKHGPYRLGGWSMGGFIAYEIARKLQEQGEEVIELSMVDTYLTKTRVKDEKTVLFNFVLQLAALPGKSVSQEEMLAWKDKTFTFDDVCDELRRLTLIPEETPNEHIRHLFDVYLSTVETFKYYDPKPASPISIENVVLFRARDSHEELGIWPTLVNNVNLHRVDADHFGIVHHPKVAEIISQIGMMSDMEMTE